MGAGSLALVAALAVPASASDVEVPILGQTVSLPTNRDEAPGLVLTVHGVRRVAGGTVVYWSGGYPASAAGSSLELAASASLGGTALNYFRKNVGDALGNVAAIDLEGLKAYSGLVDSSGRCLCTAADQSGTLPLAAKPGQALVMYTAIPELPPEVTTVDVALGQQVIPAVPVEDGALTPELDPRKPIVLGTGWPKIDESKLATADTPDQSVYPVTTRVADLEQQVATRKLAGKTSVDISSDVLFAVDKADLTPKARSTIARAVADLKAAGVKGSVSVVGHTDSDGSDAHNLDLSKRRAAAVSAALKPLLPGGVAVSVDGKGESEPIASNDTAEGKTLNRRVSITLSGGAQ
ncbi:OmpA family protein [Actinomycetota bacterium]